jgi:hypothetical protein
MTTTVQTELATNEAVIQQKDGGLKFFGSLLTLGEGLGMRGIS